MSNEILNEQIAELKTALESARAENKELLTKLSEANVEKHEEAIQKLNQQKATLDEQIEALSSELESAQTASAEQSAKLEAITEAHDQLETTLAEMAAAEKSRARKASLVEAGLSDDEAEAKMDTFGDLTDEQFAALADTLATYTNTTDTPDTSPTEDADETGNAFQHDDDKKKKKKKNHQDEDDDADASEVAEAAAEKADEEVLETAQAEEAVTLSVESDASIGDIDEGDTTRASLQDWVQTVILNNNSESGE